jgi:dipeptidyl aminopeptidase/acylaminoacyl peptidase
VRPLDAADVLKLRGVTDVQVSPDGRRVAYVVEWCDPDADAMRSAVWIDGVRATWGGRREGSPRWSPDGGALCFVSDRSGRPELWCLPVREGGEARCITSTPDAPEQPAWSPDGRMLLFCARKTPRSDKVTPQVVTHLRYLLNGSHYVGDGFWQVFAVPVAGGAARQLTEDGWHHLHPAWSPDGRRVAFCTSRNPDWDLEWVWDLYTADAADGSELRRVTSGGGVCLAPAFSPDGSRIAYLHNANPTTGSTADYHVWVVGAGGGGARDVTAGLDRGAAGREPPAAQPAPLWSPDGASLVWACREGGTTHLMRSALDGGRHQAIGPTGGVTSWPTASADGRRLAFTYSDAHRPPEAYDGDGNRLSDENAWLQDVLTIAPQGFRLQADDGLAFESLLWTPPDRRGPLPTLLEIHGGPHGATGPAFSTRHQMLVGAGFAVVSVNYRGSGGYGQAFADRIHGNWGVLEFDDCMAAVDHLVGSGVADPSRLGVFGGSYGGFMTNHVITHTDRFRAAVSMSTIASLQTLAYTIDHWESIATDQGGPPFEQPAYYAEHSPISHVQRVVTPLLILHGERDDTCPVGEADQFFAALRMQRKEVMLVRYPGEAHGFIAAGRPGTRLDAHERLLGWFRGHLA